MDIKYIKDREGNSFFPVAHEKVVIDDNGTTLESKLEDLCKTVDIEDIDNLNTSSLREDKLSTFFTYVNSEGFTPAAHSGTTGERPTSSLAVTDVGFTYFDTTLGKMIVWNGTAWVNMDGTALS